MICINDNNSVINNNYGRPENLIFLLKIPMGSRKNIFEACIQFGYAVSKRFASPDIVVVPTVKPRRPRQASNRIRVWRHRMRIQFWIFLGNVQFHKTNMKV